MKASNKSTLFTGIILLILAALFSIGLFLVPLDFGLSGPGHNNVLYILGKILYTAYGFSSVLVPVFLLVAGLSCFASKWTARKTLRLLTALVPFFTCVVTEKVCRSILALKSAPFVSVKIAVALITGAMLLIIEYLGSGILADKMNKMPFSQKLNKKFSQNQLSSRKNIAIFDDEAEKYDIENYDSDNYESDSYEGDISLSEEDEAKAKQKTLIESDEDVSNSFEADETVVSSANASVFDEALDSVAIKDYESIDEEKSTNVITQEEFAALTTPVLDEKGEEENEDVLEWKNLPPQPNTLPPEYDEDFDENDPSLEFPPKENEEPQKEEKSYRNDFEITEEESKGEIENESTDEEFNFGKESSSEQRDNVSIENAGFDEEFNDGRENASDDEDLLSPIIDETEDDFSVGNSFEDELEVENSFEEKKSEETLSEKPFSKTISKYSDAVVTNPNYPHGILIHDENDIGEDDEDSAEDVNSKSKIEKSKFPSRITLQSTPEEEADEEDEYEEDETLPFPNFDIEKPAVSHISLEKKNTFAKSNKKDKEPQGTLAFIASDVFSEMEEDIRNEQEDEREKEEESFSDEESQNGDELSEEVSFKDEFAQNEDYSESQEINLTKASSKESLKGAFQGESSVADEQIDLTHHNSATNLTKDELTDFFNAQQAENTPHTKEIVGKEPKIGGRAEKKGPYVIPSDLLIAYKDDEYWIIDEATKQAAMNLKQTLAEFNIEASIIGIKKGPVVTMFEILPAPGVKLSKIVALQDNIALSLAAQSVRIVAPIPGKQAVGIEVPNKHRSVVGFREIIEMDLPEWQKMAVPVILGKDILGKAQLIDLVKTPHMLIAGATGSGKSVCVNSLILSILYKRSYHDVKMILVDPKVVELKLYNNIPHLLTPVITEPKKALQALQYCLCEMERRYALLDGMGVRDISNYNQKIREQKIATEKLPYIVVIIDEFADLMATSGKELETIVARLTAMSRAVGIHLVLATQRPSVNVITGLIKANIPTRIAFMVASRTDSNIIIDTVGAEKLLGRGDMLYASAVDPAPIRIQGTFVTDQEVEDVVNAVKEYGEPDYIDDEIFIEDDEDDDSRDLFGEPMSDDDPLYDQALEIVVQSGKASASYIQRRLKIGYNRAARLVEEMEERGIVGPANGSKPREIIHIP